MTDRLGFKPEFEKLLSTPELAEVTGLPEATIRYWRYMGTGPKSAKLGRRVVYRESDVRQWIDEQFAKGSAA
ncbi:helix-turn-helix domain-containing protein [Propionimicrobium sp. PCR01-08-3]|uniref:helix-turn-helix transcriptional regulator n=1 Tax=Propionimicrobium sp. PCR01-08-3 TaxID=3052086 RepID=UPI00255C9B81|nr:helix-turn-helix domain-containing protein [Propionimicrobium sp. PCR01-08-3]WIY81778.1 helix-turn-helix domain-containing protein [Propionimicrobium sp. PCR01-08-3]